jgi:hypothetical protein
MASRASRLPNADIIDACTTRIAAIKKYITNSKTEIPVSGQLLNRAGVIAIFQGSLDTRAAVSTTKAELKAAQAERDDAETVRAAADDALKGWVTHRFGADSTETHAFGYGPKKVAVIPVETKQLAIERNKATREARHTMGPKAKLKVKGTTVVLTASAGAADAGASPVATSAPAVVVTPLAAAVAAPPEASSPPPVAVVTSPPAALPPTVTVVNPAVAQAAAPVQPQPAATPVVSAPAAAAAAQMVLGNASA